MLVDCFTRVRFQLEYLETPPTERLTAPLLRMCMRRADAKAMRRLGPQLTAASR